MAMLDDYVLTPGQYSVEQRDAMFAQVSAAMAAGNGTLFPNVKALTTGDDLNNYLQNGFAAVYGATNAPSPLFSSYGIVLCIQGRVLVQTYWEYGATLKNNALFNKMPVSEWRRYASSDAAAQRGWSDWECVNPYLDAGQESRTTERVAGLPVYAKALNGKTLVATGNTAFDGTNDALTNLTHIIRVDGYVGKAPLAQYAGITGMSVNASNQLVISTSGATAAAAYPVVYYLKN